MADAPEYYAMKSMTKINSQKCVTCSCEVEDSFGYLGDITRRRGGCSERMITRERKGLKKQSTIY